MKTIKEVLHNLKSKRIINSYAIEVYWNDVDHGKHECIVEVKINGIELVKKTKVFNKSMTSFAAVSDTALKELLESFIQTGIMALYENRTQPVNS